jgi:hypothetical protein
MEGGMCSIASSAVLIVLPQHNPSTKHASLPPMFFGWRSSSNNDAPNLQDHAPKLPDPNGQQFSRPIG